MPTPDPLGRHVPVGNVDPPHLPTILRRYSLTDTGLPPAGSLAEAEAIRADYNAAVDGASLPRQPLHVYRSDLRQTHDHPNDGSGRTWGYQGGEQPSAEVNYRRTPVEDGTLRNLYATELVTDRTSPGWSINTAQNLIVPELGFYHLSFLGTFDATSTALGNVLIEIKTGTGQMVCSASAHNRTVVDASGLRRLSAGEAIVGYAWHESGGNIEVTGQLQIAKVAPPAR